MDIWHDMSPKKINPSDFITVIETSKDSKKKYGFDKGTGLVVLDCILCTPTHYPASYGFIPRTYGDGRGPLDVLVLYSEPLEPHTLVHCLPIGVISMLGGGRNNEKIIAIPFNDPTYNQYQDISESPTRVFGGMSHFFRVYEGLGNEETAVKEVSGREEAVRIIEAALDSYVKNFCK